VWERECHVIEKGDALVGGGGRKSELRPRAKGKGESVLKRVSTQAFTGAFGRGKGGGGHALRGMEPPQFSRGWGGERTQEILCAEEGKKGKSLRQ